MYRQSEATPWELPPIGLRIAGMRALLIAILALAPLGTPAQQHFDVISIHLSRGEVKFERDGETVITPVSVHMHDVTVSTCIKLAYGVQQAQIVGTEGMDQQHYDIEAKTDAPANTEQVRAMLQQLLTERFDLRFHRGSKDLDANVLTVAPQGLKMKPSSNQDGEPVHQNSAMGMVAHNFTVQDLADYASGPLGTPLFDETHLSGRYDFTIDFHPYVDSAPDIHASPQSVLRAALAGELGLKMTHKHVTIDTIVIDHVQPPTAN